MGLALSLYCGSALAGDSLTFSAIQDSDNTEICALVLNQAYHRLGIKVTITPYPAKRSLFHANEGLADGELFRIKGMEKKYKNLIRVPVAINQLDAMVMTKSVDFKVTGWSSISPYKSAIRRGVKFSEQGTKGLRRALYNSNLDLGRILLETNDIDLSIIARLNGLQTMLELGDGNQLHFLEPALAAYPLYHYLHKKHADLVPKLVSVLNEMTKNGDIKKIRAKYIARTYEQ